MSVFTTKIDGQKNTVIAANVERVSDSQGKAEIHFISGKSVLTEVGYDSVRRNVAKALGKPAEADAE